MLEGLADVAAAALVLLLNSAGVALTALQLPGNWLIVLVTSAYAWWGWDPDPARRPIGVATLALLVGVALLGEVLELLLGSVAARKAGGSRRGAWLALFGGIAGAIAGSLLIPVPILGTLLGAALGAGLLSFLGDRWAGRDPRTAWRAARGAFTGRLTASLAKLAIALALWLIAAAAIVL